VPRGATVMTLWNECSVLRYLTLGLRVRPDVTVLPVGHDARITHALAWIDAHGSTAYATYAPEAAALAGRRAVPVGHMPRGGLWRVERPVERPGGVPTPTPPLR
jgi:hypothetical protein